MQRNIFRSLIPVFLGAIGVASLLGLLSMPPHPQQRVQAQALLPAPAATIRYVTPGGSDVNNSCSTTNTPCQSIQHAVDQASAGDEIRLASLEGTTLVSYTSSSANVVSVDKSLTLRGGFTYINVAGFGTWLPNIIPSIINGEQTRRGLYSTEDITLSTLIFLNGAAERGGNIYAENATVRFVATPILSGTATYGGGLYLKNCQTNFEIGDLDLGELLNLSGFVLVQNNSAQYGGGIYVEGGAPSLTAVALLTNTASVDGGGLYLQGDQSVIAGGLLQNNHAAMRGGGMFLEGSFARILAANVLSNTAGDGAGIYLDGPFISWPLNVPIIANSTLRYNRAPTGQGGGIYFRETIAGLLNNIIADNTALEGAGMYLWGASPQIYHNTIAKNQGNSGIYLTNKPGQTWPPVVPIPSYPVFTNTIISGHNTAVQVESSGLPSPLENRATLNGTLWADNTTNSAGPGEVVLGSTNVYSAAQFTCTGGAPACLLPYHLESGSPAIDAGVIINLLIPGLDTLVDIDTQARPSGAGFDIGADEVVELNFSVWILPPLSVLRADPGDILTHTHQLLNSGTETDTYDLNFSSSSGWATLNNATPLTLAAQENTTLTVRVVVPLDATSTMSDITVITATSQNTSERQAQALDTTLVITSAAMDLAIAKRADTDQAPPGGAVRYTLTITRSGDVTETTPVTLNDTLVPTTALAAWVLAPNCTGVLASGSITCTWDLPGGQNPLTRPLDIWITTTQTYSGLLSNLAIINGPNALDPTPLNNFAQATILVGEVQYVYLPCVLRTHTEIQ